MKMVEERGVFGAPQRPPQSPKNNRPQKRALFTGDCKGLLGGVPPTWGGLRGMGYNQVMLFP